MNIIIGSGFLSNHLQKKTKAEVLSHDQWRKIPHDVDKIYYLCAYGNHHFQKDLQQTYFANFGLLQEILDYLYKIRFNLFIHISTSSVLLPVQTPYSITKKAGEGLVRAYRKMELPAISVRPFSLFGEGEADFRFIPKLIHSSLNNQPFDLAVSPAHDWIHVDDFVNRLLEIKEPGEPVNIGSGVQRTNMEIYQYVTKKLGKQPVTRFIEGQREYDTGDWVCPKKDVDKFKSRINFEKGMNKTIKYYRKKYESTL